MYFSSKSNLDIVGVLDTAVQRNTELYYWRDVYLLIV